jgi:peptidoglycan/LPS O-acetylase OafA/YrhL
MKSANLDLLRAVAVLLVTVFHVLLYEGHAYRNIGEFGVLLFFVHTTLVLMFSLQRQRADFPAQSLSWIFFIRRGFRIYPLSIVVVSLSYLIHAHTSLIDPHAMIAPVATWKTITADLALVQNVWTQVSQPGPLWSLPYEMQMYLLLPACFLVATRTKWRGAVLLWFAALIVGVAVPHSLLRFAPCFMPGVIAYTLWGRVRLPWWIWPPTLGVIVVGYAVLNHYHPTGPLWLGWLACALLGFTVPLFAEMPDSVVRRAAHQIAKYSFGIYLLHAFCLWIFFDVLKAPLGVQVAGFTVTLAVLSFAAYHLVEAPFIAMGRTALEGKWLGAPMKSTAAVDAPLPQVNEAADAAQNAA